MLKTLTSSESVHGYVAKDVQMEYDVFNIANFYKFCKDHPKEYPFISKERTPELDEIVIGFWLKNQHK